MSSLVYLLTLSVSPRLSIHRVPPMGQKQEGVLNSVPESTLITAGGCENTAR